MELVALLRVLWRYRIAVAVGAIIAVGLGFMSLRGPTIHSGVASMRVHIDTPSSETVDANPTGLPTLESRTGLISDLMATATDQERIARKMGISPKSLVVSAPYMSVPPVAFPLPRAALEAAAVAPQPYHLSIQAAYLLPIIKIEASAPTGIQAGHLAAAAADAMREVAVEKEGLSSKDVALQQFAVENVGPVHVREIFSGPRKMMAIVIPALFFAAWCTGIALVAALLRNGVAPRMPRRRAAPSSS